MDSQLDAAATVSRAASALRQRPSSALAYVSSAGPRDLSRAPAMAEAFAETATQLRLAEDALGVLARYAEGRRLLLRDIHNRSTFVNRLPPELIRIILIQSFLESIGAHHHDWQDPRPILSTITSTCGTWRHIAIHTPVLWSFYYLNSSIHLVRLWLRRAGTCGLHIHGSFLSRRSLPATNIMVVPGEAGDLFDCFPRWRSFFAPWLSSFSLDSVWDRVNPVFLRDHVHLQSLALIDESGESKRSGQPWHKQLLDDTIWRDERWLSTRGEAEYPRDRFSDLRSLTLWSVDVSPWGLLRNLVNLDLYDPVVTDWDTWCRLLEQAPHLESLRLTACPPLDAGIIDWGYNENIHLTSLRSLILGPGSHVSFLMLWFDSVRAPRLEAFTMDAMIPLNERQSYALEESIPDFLAWACSLRFLRMHVDPTLLSVVLRTINKLQEPTWNHRPRIIAPVLETALFDLGPGRTNIDASESIRELVARYKDPNFGAHLPIPLTMLAIAPRMDWPQDEEWYLEHVETYVCGQFPDDPDCPTNNWNLNAVVDHTGSRNRRADSYEFIYDDD